MAVWTLETTTTTKKSLNRDLRFPYFLAKDFEHITWFIKPSEEQGKQR